MDSTPVWKYNDVMTAIKITPERLDRALARALERDRGLYLTPGQVQRIAHLERDAQPESTTS